MLNKLAFIFDSIKKRKNMQGALRKKSVVLLRKTETPCKRKKKNIFINTIFGIIIIMQIKSNKSKYVKEQVNFQYAYLKTP